MEEFVGKENRRKADTCLVPARIETHQTLSPYRVKTVKDKGVSLVKKNRLFHFESFKVCYNKVKQCRKV